MSRDPFYDEERERVGRKVASLPDRTLLRPDLQEVFELCDGVLLALTSGRIEVAVVPRLKALFDEHVIA